MWIKILASIDERKDRRKIGNKKHGIDAPTRYFEIKTHKNMYLGICRMMRLMPNTNEHKLFINII